MSSDILSSQIRVHYLDETRQKRMEWIGSDLSATVTMNAWYSALMDLFDEPGQMDDGIPMSAQTPTEYTTGIIDSGDSDPWYVQYDLMEHITGGALKTASWTRVTSTNTGIVVVPITNTSIVVANEGLNITSAAGDSGTLLELIDNGTDEYLVIRPDSSAAGDDWDSASGTITVTGAGTTAAQDAASVTGEQIWANLFSLGTIEGDTHIYVYQGAAAADADRVRVLSPNDADEDWWGDGQIDICAPIRDWTTDTAPIIDSGFFTVKAHKYTAEYSFFEVETSTTSGGRNPVPLGTKNDLNNSTGFKSITFTAAAGNWSVGDEMTGDTSDARAIITQIDNPGATQTVHYYLLGQNPISTDHYGGALTDFNTAIENLSNADDTGTGTKNGSAPANQGPALTTWFTGGVLPTIAFGTTTSDIDNDGTDEDYGILVDCNQSPLSEIYEWLKYITRYGATGTTDSDGIPGELYVGGTVYLGYATITNAIAEGESVTQATSGATGVVISHSTANDIILLRSTRGTFDTSNQVDSDDSSGFFTPTAAVAFAPNAVNPFGTYAGGTFFGARGLAIVDWIAADENSFQLTPIIGGTKERPQAFSITFNNVYGTAITDANADIVSCYRLTGAGGTIDKTEYSSNGAAALAATSITVDTAISADTPGSSTGGVLVVRDESDNNQNYYIRYDSWATSTFTLSSYAFDPTAGTNTTTIVASAAAFNTNVVRGDLVWNTTRSAHSYVVTVDSDTQLTISPAIASQTDTDSIDINVMPIDDDTLDDVYVPLLHTYPTGSTASVSIEYVATLDYRGVVRNNRAADPNGPIVPFTSDGQVTSGTDNQTVNTIRTIDAITT